MPAAMSALCQITALGGPKLVCGEYPRYANRVRAIWNPVDWKPTFQVQASSMKIIDSVRPVKDNNKMIFEGTSNHLVKECI